MRFVLGNDPCSMDFSRDQKLPNGYRVYQIVTYIKIIKGRLKSFEVV